MTTTQARIKWNPAAERELLSEPGVRILLEDIGSEAADSIRDGAPVATGELRDGIQDPELEMTSDGWRAFVGFLAWYSLIVEFSPRNRPYIRPGADAVLRRHGSRLEGARK